MRATKISEGTIKVYDGELKIYNGQSELLVSVSLSNPVRLQLIAELTDELRYPN